MKTFKQYISAIFKSTKLGTPDLPSVLSKYYKFNPGQAKTISDFTGTGALHMHRHGEKKLEAPLKAITTQHPAPRNLTVFHARGGAMIHKDTFMSASLDKETAMAHLVPDSRGYGHMDVIAIPKGAQERVERVQK